MQTNLLALNLTVVAGDQASLAQSAAQAFVIVHQGTGQAMANGAGLAAGAAALDGSDDVEAVNRLGEFQRPKYSSRLRLFTVIWPLPGLMKTRAVEVLRRPVP